MDRKSKSTRGSASSAAAAAMAALAAAAAAGDSGGSDGGGALPPRRGEEDSVAVKLEAVGDASVSSPVPARRGGAAAAASSSSPVASAARRGAATATAASVAAAGGGGGGPRCQAERCNANLMEEKTYNRRHKVCEAHSKAPVVLVAGLRQRFCQQCSRFHELSEFDDIKRSCRLRLAGHNERRRKSSADAHAAGSGSNGFRQHPDQNGRGGDPAAGNHFQIR